MIATIVIGCVLFFSGETEPSYAGKSLSAWVDTPIGVGLPTKPSSEAVSAIRAIGTNALPFLVEWIRYEPSVLRQKAEPHVRSLPSWLLHPPLIWRLLYRDAYRAHGAKDAFIALGPAAAPAVPQLHAIFLATTNSSVRGNVVFSLLGMGPEATPALTNIAATTDYGALIVLQVDRRYSANVEAFTPILINYLRGTNFNMALIGLAGLARFQPDPEHSVPALIAALERPEEQIRVTACMALANYGAEARAALPALNRLTSETAPGTQVNLTARIAIEKITGVASQ